LPILRAEEIGVAPLTSDSPAPAGTARQDAGLQPLTRWQRRGLIALLAIFVLHGIHVEHRSLFLKRRMNDLGVYLRAAWAVRTGANLYEVTDSNGFHYVYPPLLAILLVPLADPPRGADPILTLPFALSVPVWYAFNVVCLWWGCNWLAGSLELAKGIDDKRDSYRWWTLRIGPIVVCLPMILDTLVHGQVNLLLLALLCGMAGSLLRGRTWLAGLFLSGAICLKVFPAFLLIYVFWRREFRCLAGCGVGLLIGLCVIPALIWGPRGALDYHRQFAERVLLPGAGAGTDRSLANELTGITATDSQSLVAVIHNTLHMDRATRPREAPNWERWLALGTGGVLTVLSLLAAGWRRRQSASSDILFFGQLLIVMLINCPVCHLSYFCLGLPIIMVVFADVWLPAWSDSRTNFENRDRLQRNGPRERAARMLKLLICWFVIDVTAHSLPHVPGLECLRDIGLAAYATLFLWFMAGLMLRNFIPSVQSVVETSDSASVAAA
jgi:hypothetical protein